MSWEGGVLSGKYFLYENAGCGYTLEAPGRNSCRNKKNILKILFEGSSLSEAMYKNLFYPSGTNSQPRNQK